MYRCTAASPKRDREPQKAGENRYRVAAVHRTLPACAPGGTPATASPTATTAAGLGYRTTNRIPGSDTMLLRIAERYSAAELTRILCGYATFPLRPRLVQKQG